MGKKTYSDLNDLLGDLDRESVLSEEEEELDEEDIEILHQPVPPPPPKKPPKRPVRKPAPKGRK